MRVSLIVAVAENGVIGRGGALPWRLSADLQRFKQLTMGHHLIMGRKTFDSIGRGLPGRTTIVISRQADLPLPLGCRLAASLDDALRIAEAAVDSEAFVIGGAAIYRLALPKADRVYLTAVHANVEGDTFFREFDETKWLLSSEERHPADAKNEFDYSFRVYDSMNRANGNSECQAR
jgi:dihydrofolate reductase